MYKYLLKFEKKGDIRYISHLDLMRQFQRAFKRAEIGLAFSQGFNPHPKMSFGQPLSLGFTSSGEYLEFETVDLHRGEDILRSMNQTLPNGITVKACLRMPAIKKTASALVSFADYEIKTGNPWPGSARDHIADFLSRPKIDTEKKAKKRKLVTVDIRPMIYGITVVADTTDELILRTTLAAGSNANLNPELLLSALFNGENCPAAFPPQIERLELYSEERQPLETLADKLEEITATT